MQFQHISASLIGEKATQLKKPQPFCLAQRCEVLFSHKGRLFVTARLSVPVPDSKLCALLLFFPHGADSRPLLSIYWLSPAGSSMLIGWRAHRGGFGRFSFVYILAEETPITTVTLGNQAIDSYPDRHTQTRVQDDRARAHTYNNEVTRCPKPGQLRSLCSLVFMLDITQNIACMCIFLVRTVSNHVVSLSDETFHSMYTFTKPCLWLQAIKERCGCALQWAYVPVCL